MKTLKEIFKIHKGDTDIYFRHWAKDKTFQEVYDTCPEAWWLSSLYETLQQTLQKEKPEELYLIEKRCLELVKNNFTVTENVDTNNYMIPYNISDTLYYISFCVHKTTYAREIAKFYNHTGSSILEYHDYVVLLEKTFNINNPKKTVTAQQKQAWTNIVVPALVKAEEAQKSIEKQMLDIIKEIIPIQKFNIKLD